MGEGNNPGGNIQNSESGHTDIEYNCMGGMESPQQNAECENPNRSEQKRDCVITSYDDDDDMPDFDAMLGDFEGAHVPGEYKAMATLKVDTKTNLYRGCKRKYSKLSATLIFLRYEAKYSDIIANNFARHVSRQQCATSYQQRSHEDGLPIVT